MSRPGETVRNGWTAVRAVHEYRRDGKLSGLVRRPQGYSAGMWEAQVLGPGRLTLATGVASTLEAAKRFILAWWKWHEGGER